MIVKFVWIECCRCILLLRSFRFSGRNRAVDDLPSSPGHVIDSVFADLLGASAEARRDFLLQALGGETALLLAAAAPLFAAALSRRVRMVAVVGALAVIAAAVSNDRIGFFQVPGVLKAMRRHMEELRIARDSNRLERIFAHRRVEGFPQPNLARLYIDSDA
jgi:hypothetical protein